MLTEQIFSIASPKEFLDCALEVFRYQYLEVPVYRRFCDLLNVKPKDVYSLETIPFLPIQFFKSQEIIAQNKKAEILFTSSGTTGQNTSNHFVARTAVYEKSFFQTFKENYGPASDYVILALLPSYLEREGSSLIYMVDALIASTNHPESGFYLHDLKGLAEKIKVLESRKQKTLLIGVSYALLDLIEEEKFYLKHTIVMETGGMKGRRKEMIKEELHAVLKEGFGVPQIHSEYGMTELLSQAYSQADGLFHCPPWMKILIRDPEDARHFLEGKTGGINVIDMANIYSCAFIATQDLGKIHSDKSFEIVGRFDNSDIRGCNLMVL